jgi:membrane-bound lytic murein transglycosylase F
MRIFVLSLFLLLFISCEKKKQEIPVPKQNLLSKIKKRGKLVAITQNSANTYFLYRGEPMGFEYELLKRFANDLGVELELKIPKQWSEMFSMLERGEGDIIAAHLTVTKERKKKVDFSDYYLTTHQVLVQKLPENWRKMKRHEIEQRLVRNPIELIGEEIHVVANSSYIPRLKSLSEEIGGEIKIKIIPDTIHTQTLIRMVNEGKIKYTVADETIAKINGTRYQNIDYEMPIGFSQQIAWAFPKDSDSLKNYVNKWLYLAKYSNDPTFNIIYDNYFNNYLYMKRKLRSDYLYSETGKLSMYDDLIKQYSDSLDWDWRLLASQIYQESGFNSKRISWAGAQGLMQVMPRTGKSYGYENLLNPEENLKAGTAYLQFLMKYWDFIKDNKERLKFILASYNVGQGHVQDARNLARKFGKSPNIWDENVEEYLRLKSNPKYFRDDVVKYGYCRGDEPTQYVREVLDTYKHYQNVY